MLRIGFDAQATLGQLSGLGTYTSHLIQSLTGRTEISARHHRPLYEFYFYRDERYCRNTPSRLLWENAVLPGLLKKDKVDIVHVPAFSPALFKRTRTIVTVHDLIGMLFPNQVGRVSRFYWGTWLPAAVKSAEAFIADSQSTRTDMIRHLRIPEKKITVIYPSGHEGFFSLPADSIQSTLKQQGIDRSYFLFVGTLEPRKNLFRALRVFDMLNKSSRAGQFKFVVVGSKQFAHGSFFEKLKDSLQNNSSEDILFTGYVSHEELNHLYCGATALVYPSLYEGFGIPILEAMASSCPVITSTTSSTSEVAGNAALLVDPEDEMQLLCAMEQLADSDSLRQRLRDAGLRQIQKFSWKKTAEETLKVYESMG